MISSKIKQSQGHVEMILSFAIFVGFVFTMFFFLNPAKEDTTSYAALDVAENVVLDNISVNFRYIALILETPRPVEESCFSVPNNFNLSEGLLAIDQNNLAVNSYNNIITPSRIYIKPQDKSLRLYKLYFADAFADYVLPESERINCVPLDLTDYSFGVLTTENLVMFEKLASFQAKYFDNYKKLKSELRVAEDFEFLVYNLNRTQILFDTTSVHKFKTSLVLAREIPLRMVDMNGTQSDAVVNFRVW